ncbi:3'-5' exoribonuclease [Geobacter anodireducens]
MTESDTIVRAPGRRLLFLDTEFTDLTYGRLISIGLVADTGESFYAELTDGWQLADCSQFVKDVVLPLLQGGSAAMTRTEARQRLSQWIQGFTAPVWILSDATDFDWPLVKGLLSGAMPSNLIPYPALFMPANFTDLQPQLLECRQRTLAGRPEHHALYDAEALRAVFLFLGELLGPEALARHYGYDIGGEESAEGG